MSKEVDLGSLRTHQSHDERNLGETNTHIDDFGRVYGAFLTQLLKKEVFSCRRSGLTLSSGCVVPRGQASMDTPGLSVVSLDQE